MNIPYANADMYGLNPKYNISYLIIHYLIEVWRGTTSFSHLITLISY